MLALHDPNDNHISIHTRGVDANSADHTFAVKDGTTASISPLSGRTTNVTIVSTPSYFHLFIGDNTGPSLNLTDFEIEKHIPLDEFGAVF